MSRKIVVFPHLGGETINVLYTLLLLVIKFIILLEEPIISLQILIFKDEIFLIVLTSPFDITHSPANPTLCPPFKVIYPCFISSSKAYKE